MGELVITAEDPRTADVRELLERHLAFAHATTPVEDVHALGVDGLLAPDVSLFACRRHGVLLGVGALRTLDAEHGELKSMHTLVTSRGQGVGRAMVGHLLGVARDRGYRRVSLETGTMEAFAPARALYRSVGFEPCEPFGDYWVSPNSTCMTLVLDARR